MTDADPEDLILQSMTLTELDAERRNLLEEMNAIRNQLTARKADIDAQALQSGKVDRYGVPLVGGTAWVEYNRWRASATAALRHKEVELADLKSEMKNRRQALGSGVKEQMAPLSDDPTVMLAHLLKVTRSFASALGFARVTPEEQAIIDHVQSFLNLRAPGISP